ncbi:hypothetical protein AGMMS49938_08620 [Fibrobacterales bacterium]|nr:hypothetical protein AGMMS49938_08620 [Fibrobacterales bacterium]
MPIIILFLAAAAMAQTDILPIFSYEYAHAKNQNISSPNAGFLLRGVYGDTNKADTLVVGAFYQRYNIGNPVFDSPNLYHDINFLAQYQTGRHKWIALFRSTAAKPIYGGMFTTLWGGLYGYEVQRNGIFTTILGGGIGEADGWVLPFPMIQVAMNTQLVSAYFEYIGNLRLDLTLRPGKKFRMTNEISIETYSGIHGVAFDCLFWFRPFANGDTEDHQAEFAGIGIGIKNRVLEFALDKTDEFYEANYYALNGVLDITFLKFSGGYIFKGKEKYKTAKSRSFGEGYYVAGQALYIF